MVITEVKIFTTITVTLQDIFL